MIFSKNIISACCVTVCSFALLFSASTAHAAVITLSPTTVSVNSGGTFSVKIAVDPQANGGNTDQLITTVRASINYPGFALTQTSYVPAAGWTYSGTQTQSKKTQVFSGGISKLTDFGTMTFKVGSPSVMTISVALSSSYANTASGANTLSGTQGSMQVTVVEPPPPPPDTSQLLQLHGFAWGAAYIDAAKKYPAGIGWLSFNCADINPDCDPFGNNDGDYSVTYNSSTGALNGWAWSSTVGWIHFGGLGSSFPSGPDTTAADATLSRGKLTGWARACLGTANGDCSSSTARAAGDWDGWISLNGSATNSIAYGVSYSIARAFTGWSWGGPDLGWISWSCLNQSSTCNPSATGAGQYGVWADIPDTPYVELQVQDTDGNLVPSPNADVSGLPVTFSQGIANEGVTLAWDATGVSGCHPEGGDTAWQSLDLSTLGSTLPIVHPGLGETQYSISCIDSNLSKHSSTVSVFVVKDSPISLSFTVSAPSDTVGTDIVTLPSTDFVKLRWTALGLDSTGSCSSYVPDNNSDSPYFGTFSTGSDTTGTALSDATIDQRTYFGIKCSDSQNTKVAFVEADTLVPTWSGSQCVDPLTKAKYGLNAQLTRYSKRAAQTLAECTAAKQTFTCVPDTKEGYVVWSPSVPYQYTSCTIDPNYHEH